MRTRPRFRRAAIATGLTASLLILAAWVVSLFWLIGYTNRNRTVLINLGFGRLNCLHFAQSPDDSFEAVPDFIHDFQSEFRTRVSVFQFWGRRHGLFANKLESSDGRWTEKLGLGLPIVKKQDPRTTGKFLAASMPLWLPFLLTVISTAYVWYRRRPQPGHCPSCDYNLTANQSGKCPECGTPTPKPEPAAPAPAPNVRTRSASAGQDRVP